MTKTELISKIRNHIDQLYQQIAHKKDQRLQVKFDPQLFAENHQTYAFYFQQLQNSLEKLESLNEKEIALCAFMSEKLLSQYMALSEALAIQQPKILPVSTAQKHRIHQLPPRERLEKYYEALHALNQKITDYEDEKRKCTDPVLEVQCQQRIVFTHQRRLNCLNAIEALEEYLLFKRKK